MSSIAIDTPSAPGAARMEPNGISMRSPPPGLGKTLNTQGIDIPDEDESFLAKLTRAIVNCTGQCFTPFQLLFLLRILKTVTVLFLVFTVIADLMYIVFVKFFASSDVDIKVGGPRDTIIRIYGLALTAMALAIELDFDRLTRHFSGLRGFIPRSFLLFFIAAITSAHPLHASYTGKNYSAYDYIDDDLYDQAVTTEIPHSTVAFQMVTSFVLLLCSLFYFVFGLLCFDRFTNEAFVTYEDPVQATAIPPPTKMVPLEAPGELKRVSSDYVKV